MEFDKIVVTNQNPNEIKEIKKQLEGLSVDKDKIIIFMEDAELKLKVLSKINAYNEETDQRVGWLKDFAEYVYDTHMVGNVAECGVYRGEFAYFINKFFKDRRLYLFDTFAGFDKEDVNKELNFGNPAFNDSKFAKWNIFGSGATDEEIVKRRMLFPDNCMIKKGYFPESAAGLKDVFCFVNLDMDLYTPMYSALDFFYDSMADGGVILLHDYFHPELPGVKRAVEDFEKKLNGKLCKVPIGDGCSIAIIKATV